MSHRVLPRQVQEPTALQLAWFQQVCMVYMPTKAHGSGWCAAGTCHPDARPIRMPAELISRERAHLRV